MAEALGLAASGIAVVSLAIQVAENINKLKSFVSKVKDAPSDILFVVDELEALSLVLEDVDRSMQESIFMDPRVKTTVLKSYRLCKSSGDALSRLVTELEKDIWKGKKRGGFKVAMKKERIDELQKKLESAKATMLLANSVYYQAFQNQKWESLERDIIELKESHRVHQSRLESGIIDIRTVVLQIPNASKQSRRIQEEGLTDDVVDKDEALIAIAQRSRKQPAKKTAQEGYKMLFGCTDIVKVNQGKAKTTSVSFGLPSWIYARRFHIAWTRGCKGWDQSFQTYRVISEDADVFHLSMEGDVKGLQQLFEAGLASPFEVDPDGRTPLHYAAFYARPEACRFLLEMGADANVPTSWHGEFHRDQLNVGRGLYEYMGDIKYGEVFRAWPSYSTPLHLLSSIGNLLFTYGRQAITNNHYSSEMSMEDDFKRTVEILVSNGNSDVFQEDQYGRTIFHILGDQTSSFQWLTRQESPQIAAMTPEEITDLLVFMSGSNLEIVFPMFRAILPEGKITTAIAEARAQADLWGQGYTLLHRAVEERAREVARANHKIQSLNDGWKDVILELLAAGANPHAMGIGKYTVLKEVMRVALFWGTRAVERVTAAWVQILYEAGVDVIEYSRVENSMSENDELLWVCSRHIEMVDGYNYFFTFQLLEFKVWRKSEDNIGVCVAFDDLWATTPLAADFWSLVEEELDEEDESDEMGTIPGSWQED